MKCLLINTFENRGGAARSTHRLYAALNGAGIDAQMLVQFRQSMDPKVFGPTGRWAANITMFRPYIDALPLLLYRSRLSPPWGLAWLPKNIDNHLDATNPDIVHLNLTDFGFLSLRALSRIQQPIVWTLHDSWAFTGGCHLPADCTRYREQCGKCPQLHSRYDADLSRWVWQRKRSLWQKLRIRFVAPSRWMADKIRSSALFSHVPVDVIPNGIDTSRYCPCSRSDVRQRLGLPVDRKLILFGAAAYDKDENKGATLLKKALAVLADSDWHTKVELVTFGASADRNIANFGIKTHSFGMLHDETKLAQLYAAADLFVLPSLQENLPNTVMEAMACGTPVVAFDVGGVSDMIIHEKNGYLAKPFDPVDLAYGMTWLITDDQRLPFISNAARKKIEEEFDLHGVAQKYTSLYEDILTADASRRAP